MTARAETPRQAAARRKREQRERQRTAALRPFTRENIDAAILDAVALAVKSGDPDGHAEAVVKLAAQAFHFPPQARNVISDRLKQRRLKFLDAKPKPKAATAEA